MSYSMYTNIPWFCGTIWNNLMTVDGQKKTYKQGVAILQTKRNEQSNLIAIDLAIKRIFQWEKMVLRLQEQRIN